MQEVNREELQDLRYELNDLAERYIRTFGNSKEGMEGLAEDLARFGDGNTKGSALVIPLLPPRARERGAEELPHTPRRRLSRGGGSSVRSARASVRRNDAAVPTSRARGA
ncbi:hypothetical protein [Pseudomonas aeruginosa]|uniref:hypothetical protein n=1 Tax=Pseudomonas aeruginosa TaxID=287 RepID=UPI000AEB637E|nr:hypothetical protein [Pseudomonas aeruginosa]